MHDVLMIAKLSERLYTLISAVIIEDYAFKRT